MPLHITSTTKSVKFIRPTSKAELMSIIKEELKRQGPDANLNYIDVSMITDMSYLFVNCPDVRNIKIDQWDVSNVTNMDCMFEECEGFNADLSGWDVSKVENMNSMFNSCCNFNCDLSSWDTGNVVNMDYMFCGCMNLDTDLSKWNVANVISHRKFADFCTTQFYNNMPNFS